MTHVRGICSVWPGHEPQMLSCQIIAEDVGGDVEIAIYRIIAPSEISALRAHVEGFEQTIAQGAPCEVTHVDLA